MFLANCTTAEITDVVSLELTAYTAYDASDPAEKLEEIITNTSERFGTGCKEPIAFHYPSGNPHATNKYTWSFTKDKLQELVQYIIANSPMPKSNFGPLELSMTYNFNLVDPKNKSELPDQMSKGSLLVWFSRGKSCSPTLIFPFEQADQQFWNYIDSIAPYLPFRLEEKYLRIAHVNKQGEVRSFKKIQRPL